MKDYIKLLPGFLNELEKTIDSWYEDGNISNEEYEDKLTLLELIRYEFGVRGDVEM